METWCHITVAIAQSTSRSKTMVSKILSSIIAVVATAALDARHLSATLAFTSPLSSNHSPGPRIVASSRATAGIVAPDSELRMSSSFFADATDSKKKVVADVAVVAPSSGGKVQVDASGTAFAPGCAVAVSPRTTAGGRPPIRAHSVPKACYGSLDEATGGFVPRDGSDAARATSCLVLPGGLRGIVEKVYDTNEWDRARPIVVRFGAGRDREGGDPGGFDVPKAFSMHFNADELDVLDC